MFSTQEEEFCHSYQSTHTERLIFPPIEMEDPLPRRNKKGHKEGKEITTWK
jgi:hypothetical protein